MSNNIQFPVSTITWREMLSFQECSGLDYLCIDFQIPVFIFIFPFLFITLLFKDIITYKYTFFDDKILKHSIFIFSKSINQNNILSITLKESKNKIEILWKKKKYSARKSIIIFRKTLEKNNLDFEEFVLELRHRYIK